MQNSWILIITIGLFKVYVFIKMFCLRENSSLNSSIMNNFCFPFLVLLLNMNYAYSQKKVYWFFFLNIRMDSCHMELK